MDNVNNVLPQIVNFGFPAVAFIILAYVYRMDMQRHERAMENTNTKLLSTIDSNTQALLSLQKTVESLSTIARLEDRLRDRGYRG